MTPDLSSLDQHLEKSPEDWSIRIRLIEECVLIDDMDGARQLVRESPDDSPLPGELQYRLHTLMTQGRSALAHLEPAIEDIRFPPKKAITEKVELFPGKADPAVLETDPGKDSSHSEERTDETSRKPDESELAPAGEISHDRKLPGIVKVDLKKLKEEREGKWEDCESDFHLENSWLPHARERQSAAAQKVSAFSTALLLHITCFFLLGFIVIAIPSPQPPKLIATIAQDFTDDITPTRITRSTDPKPAAASAPPANVIGSELPSAVSIPAMEETKSIDVTTMVTGIQPVGIGMSFKGDARESSDVNFFGIAAAGKRIVFIIDATKFMLVDEKGGMYAYDKVKDEIAAMLSALNRGTHFNILLYEGKRVVAFRDQPIPGMPSNLRLAIEWLDPLNRTYEELGLAGQSGEVMEMADEVEPIQNIDLAHYLKPIQKALEWEAGAIFCISSGYYQIGQSPSPEMLAKFVEERAANPGTPGTPGEFAPGAQEKWREANTKTRDWLRDENAARAEKGLPPKVVINFNSLVREVTGETPPRRSGGTPGDPGARYPNQPPHTPDDIEDQVKNSVKKYYKEKGIDDPSLHMVVFIGEDEEMQDQTKDHFRNLTRRNNGKLKVLKGLAMLEDVTKKK